MGGKGLEWDVKTGLIWDKLNSYWKGCFTALFLEYLNKVCLHLMWLKYIWILLVGDP